MITVSIVSHGHGAMVIRLIDQIVAFPEVTRIVVTLNIPEELSHASSKCLFLRNSDRKGFSANNNTAFLHCETEFFCVLNPDIELSSDPFPHLLQALTGPKTAVAAPLVTDGNGQIEASAREFPTLKSLMIKAFGQVSEGYKICACDEIFHPHWIAGMFMLFRSSDYRAVGGFNERFFLYYEDVDICARLWKSGRRVAICPSAHVIHHAQRSSHKSWKYRRWHAASMLRYLLLTRLGKMF